METLFFLFAVIDTLALCAVFAPRSFSNVAGSFAVFFASMPVTELAWLWLPAQALVLVIGLFAGAIDGMVSLLSAIIMLVFCAVMAKHVQMGLRSGATLQEGITRALGGDFLDGVSPERRSRLRTQVSFDDYRFPFKFAHPDVEVIRHLSYRDNIGERNQLDIYRPRQIPEGGCPVLLQIHGGAWVVGDKGHQALPLMSLLASRGWICVAVNYRLSPSVSFPAHIEDCKAALAWVRECGKEYGMNPDFVAVTGGSAGGHLAALMGVTANNKQLQPGFEDADTSVQACLPMYGVYDMIGRYGQHPNRELAIDFIAGKVIHTRLEDNPELWDLASPIAQIHPDAPPFLIMHGERDSLAPVSEALMFTEKLRAVANNPVVYIELEGTDHAWELFHSPRTEYTINIMHQFLEWAYARHLQEQEDTKTTASATEQGSAADVA